MLCLILAPGCEDGICEAIRSDVVQGAQNMPSFLDFANGIGLIVCAICRAVGAENASLAFASVITVLLFSCHGLHAIPKCFSVLVHAYAWAV